MISLNNLFKHYTIKEQTIQKIPVIENLSLEVMERDFFVIQGPSGSGKTTLLRIIGGLTKPDGDDEIIVSRNKLGEMTQEQLALFRSAYIGFVFQDFHLIPTLTCLENVKLPLELSGALEEEANDIAIKFLKEVGLESRKNHFPFQLSGGEQQRAAFARALVNYPSILLADEPTANLDLKTRNFIIDILKRFYEEYDLTVVVSTHDERIVELATCILDLNNIENDLTKFKRLKDPKETSLPEEDS